MAERLTERQRLALKLDALNDAEVGEVLDYISIMESMRRAISDGPIHVEDDLITTLADARENKRARQAHEWESVRRRAEKRAAAMHARA
jgi:F0F1-type ATP synthase epsilon subunit